MGQYPSMTDKIHLSDYYIANPVFPYACFKLEWLTTLKPTGCVITMHLVTEFTQLTSEKISELTAEVRAELKLQYLQHGYCGSACELYLHKNDLPRIYEIIQAFTSRGYKIEMLDGTKVIFPAFTQLTYELQQTLLLKKLQDFPQDKLQFIHTVCWHRSSFWTIEEGQKFAAEYRQKHRLKDEFNLDEHTEGEYFMDCVRQVSPPGGLVVEN